MQTLFPVDPLYPGGFDYEDNFITPEEEERLLNEIATIELRPFVFQGYEARRRVASFGYDWSFERQELKKGKAIPNAFVSLIDRVATRLLKRTEDFCELLVTEYPAGSLINWHRDAPPFDLIAGISLRQDCEFRLRPHEKEKQGKNSMVKLLVRRRSLYIMQGEVRSRWQHSTAPVTDTRYSITLRTLRKNEP